ncbi:MAG: RNA-binding S4 domain-containing protein [Rikenellaceae bacterium]
MQDIRLDKYLWSVRIYKTRSVAADAIRANRVLVNGAYCKPSREVKIGDKLTIKATMLTYSYEVVDLVSNRQPAKNVALYLRNITPQSELDKLTAPRETIFVTRDRGTGRPTKRDRRQIDMLMDEFDYDPEADE